MMRGREQEREMEGGRYGTGKPEDGRERNCQINEKEEEQLRSARRLERHATWRPKDSENEHLP